LEPADELHCLTDDLADGDGTGERAEDFRHGFFLL
jgi:hypothetical protein